MFYDLIIVGGGAAGIFAALRAKTVYPYSRVLVLEKYGTLLNKVRVSGGGRCNVTHACFDPLLLTKNYPRGTKELRGPFQQFQPQDMINWLTERTVSLKTEQDGRIFPTSDQSETIITCFLKEAKKLNVEIRTQQKILTIERSAHFSITLQSGEQLHTTALLLATGSSADGYQYAKQLGHTIIAPVPSLFTFNIPHFALTELAGIACEVQLSLVTSALQQQGRLLITHWGFSGPAVLKLSAWAAPLLFDHRYRMTLKVDWLPDFTLSDIEQALKKLKQQFPQQTIGTQSLFALPKNLWKKFLQLLTIDDKKKLADWSFSSISQLSQKLKADLYPVDGKTTHKEEFVTCGGVDLAEINFKTLESKSCKGLFFAGEILNIDAVTGGFNFQNAWTTGWLAGQACLS